MYILCNYKSTHYVKMHRLANFKIVTHCCSFSVLHMNYLSTKVSPYTVLFNSVFRAIVFMRIINGDLAVCKNLKYSYSNVKPFSNRHRRPIFVTVQSELVFKVWLMHSSAWGSHLTVKRHKNWTNKYLRLYTMGLSRQAVSLLKNKVLTRPTKALQSAEGYVYC